MENRGSNIFMLIVFICASISYSQNDEGLTLLEDSDDIRIKFENHFFEALKFKAIGNFSRAITELEKCQQLSEGYVQVQFEFSKNYYLLNKYNDASHYIEIALISEPRNYWFLILAKNIYVKQNEISKAIEVQKNIIALKPAKKEDLVLLYIKANDRGKAQNLIDELTSKGISSSKLRNYQKAIERHKKPSVKPETSVESQGTIGDLKELYEAKKQFLVLKKILEFELIQDNEKEFKVYSEEGMEMFPAQPFVYLMYGISLNKSQNFKEAIDVLSSGLDFIVDDRILQAEFYDQLAISYDGLKQIQKGKESRSKAVQYRSKKD